MGLLDLSQYLLALMHFVWTRVAGACLLGQGFDALETGSHFCRGRFKQGHARRYLMEHEISQTLYRAPLAFAEPPLTGGQQQGRIFCDFSQFVAVKILHRSCVGQKNDGREQKCPVGRSQPQHCAHRKCEHNHADHSRCDVVLDSRLHLHAFRWRGVVVVTR